MDEYFFFSFPGSRLTDKLQMFSSGSSHVSYPHVKESASQKINCLFLEDGAGMNVSFAPGPNLLRTVKIRPDGSLVNVNVDLVHADHLIDHSNVNFFHARVENLALASGDGLASVADLGLPHLAKILFPDQCFHVVFLMLGSYDICRLSNESTVIALGDGLNIRTPGNMKDASDVVLTSCAASGIGRVFYLGHGGWRKSAEFSHTSGDRLMTDIAPECTSEYLNLWLMAKRDEQAVGRSDRGIAAWLSLIPRTSSKFRYAASSGMFLVVDWPLRCRDLALEFVTGLNFTFPQLNLLYFGCPGVFSFTYEDGGCSPPMSPLAGSHRHFGYQCRSFPGMLVPICGPAALAFDYGRIPGYMVMFLNISCYGNNFH